MTLDAVAEHWARARADAKIDGDTIRVTTSGVTAMHIAFDLASRRSPRAPGRR